MWENMLSVTGFQMRVLPAIAVLMMTPLLHAVEWSIEHCSSLDLLAGRTGIADTRPSNDPHHNSDQMMEQNSGIYRGQWSWQSEMPELLYEIMHTGEAGKVSPSGFTALHAACVYADENLFRALLDAGVPVDARAGDWQQLGYVGDTPLGLLVRFMHPRTAAARVRMARVLLEKGANPDAPMTTWKGDRMVTTVPFCEMGNQDCNHDMRKLLLEFGNSDLKSRMGGWHLCWDWYKEDLRAHLKKHGVGVTKPETVVLAQGAQKEIGRVPLLDLIRKGEVEGVRKALESGVSIEVSARARRYGQEPLFNIPARKKDSPEAAVEIARLLVEAGADVNELNRRGTSLRIYYDKFYSKASRALCAYFRSCGAVIHPDSPDRRAEVEKTRQEAQARAAVRAARLAEAAAAPEAQPEPAPVAETPAATEPQPEPAPVAETPAATEPQPEPAPVAETPAATEPQPEPAPVAETPAATEPHPEPAPVAETPAATEPQPEPAPVAGTPVATEPQPEPAAVAETPAATEPQPEPAPVAETPAEAEPKREPATVSGLTEEASSRLVLEVQAQLEKLQARYEAERLEKEKQAEQEENKSESTPE